MMNNWIDAEKIVESFMWYSFSKLKDEQIEENLMNYKEEMKKSLYKKLKKENPLPDFQDEVLVMKREQEIKKEVEKNENLFMDTMVSKLKFGKEDWKNILGIMV